MKAEEGWMRHGGEAMGFEAEGTDSGTGSVGELTCRMPREVKFKMSCQPIKGKLHQLFTYLHK